MSNFHPVASSLVNFNDTISMTRLFFINCSLLLFLAFKLLCKCDVHGPHFQINTELFSSRVVCPAFRFFLPATKTTHFYHVRMLPKMYHGFVGVVKFCRIIFVEMILSLQSYRLKVGGYHFVEMGIIWSQK